MYTIYDMEDDKKPVTLPVLGNTKCNTSITDVCRLCDMDAQWITLIDPPSSFVIWLNNYM